MTLSEIEYARRALSETELADIKDEVNEEIRELKLGRYQFNPETRCRVCKNDDDREMIDKLLSTGMTYTHIMRVIQPINDKRKVKERITYNSLYVHAKKDFPLNKGAQAVYRGILEKRAEDYNQDFVKGVTSIVNLFSYLEIMGMKGMEQLMSDEPNVSVKDGMDALVKLHDLTTDSDSERKIREIMVQFNSLIGAVQDNVKDPEIMKKILDQIQDTQVDALDVEEVTNDEGYQTIENAEEFVNNSGEDASLEVGGSH